MSRGAGRSGRFVSLPVLAAVLFFVLAAGSQYNPGTTITSPDGSYQGGFLPNAAQAWSQMQGPLPTGWAEIIVLDTLAVISPLPLHGMENVTVYFTSMSGYPFRMLYYAPLAGLYGDLHPGARVLALFDYSDTRGDWVLLYVVNAEENQGGLH